MVLLVVSVSSICDRCIIIDLTISYLSHTVVDPNKVPCGTVLESAKIHKKMKTGLVVTSRITHATPASFSAHINWRDWENQIAEHQLGYTPLGKTVDLMFGGGLCEFLKNTTQGSCRADKKDLIARGQKDFGWQLKTTRQEFDALDENAKMPLLGLFANQVLCEIHFCLVIVIN